MPSTICLLKNLQRTLDMPSKLGCYQSDKCVCICCYVV